MRHHRGMSVPDSGYARHTGGMNSFLGLVFLQMAASVALSAVSVVGLSVGVMLSAYDMQHLKRVYAEHVPTPGGASASLGALTLYLDFLNLVLSLLRFTGRRR